MGTGGAPRGHRGHRGDLVGSHGAAPGRALLPAGSGDKMAAAPQGAAGPPPGPAHQAAPGQWERSASAERPIAARLCARPAEVRGDGEGEGGSAHGPQGFLIGTPRALHTAPKRDPQCSAHGPRGSAHGPLEPCTRPWRLLEPSCGPGDAPEPQNPPISPQTAREHPAVTNREGEAAKQPLCGRTAFQPITARLPPAASPRSQ